jgi:hypothetical protein
LKGDPYVPPTPTPTPHTNQCRISNLELANRSRSWHERIASRSRKIVGWPLDLCQCDESSSCVYCVWTAAIVGHGQRTRCCSHGRASQRFELELVDRISDFLGANGTLTQNAPQSGFLIQVATPITPHTIEFEIQEPILL